MMVMARFVAAALVASCLLAVVAGCGGDSSDTGAANPDLLVMDVAYDVPGFVGFHFDNQSGDYVIRSTAADIDLEQVKDSLLRHGALREEQIANSELVLELVQTEPVGLTELLQEVTDKVISRLPYQYRADIGFWDVDEINNRVLVAFTSEEARKWAINEIAERIDAPPGAIVVVFESPGQDD